MGRIHDLLPGVHFLEVALHSSQQMRLVGDETVAFYLAVDLVLGQLLDYLRPLPLRPEKARLIEHVRALEVVDSLVPATAFEDLSNHRVVIAGIVSIKLVEKGLCNITSC